MVQVRWDLWEKPYSVPRFSVLHGVVPSLRAPPLLGSTGGNGLVTGRPHTHTKPEH